jgi:DNA polymerase-3 subunit epsilon
MIRLVRPLVSLDLEVHDLTSPRIVEIGFIMYFPTSTTPPVLTSELPGEEPVVNRPPKEWSHLVNPGVPISQETTRIHGIRDEDVASAPHFGQLASNIAKGFKNVDFIGYNLLFDLRILKDEMSRFSIDWTYDGAKLIDAYRLWQTLEPRRLTDAVEHFLGRAPTSNHRALGDAKDAYDVALAMLDAGDKTRSTPFPRSVDALHALCFPPDPTKIDSSGKFVWRGAEPVINFGKHARTPLKHVPKDYLQWIVGKSDLPSEVKRICADALDGHYPTRQQQERV